MPTETLTNREWLAGEHLSRLECWKASWFLDTLFQGRGEEMPLKNACTAKIYSKEADFFFQTVLWTLDDVSSICTATH